MPQTAINNFSGGMIQDLDKSLKPNHSYQYAKNLRYLANINDNTGTLHSVESSDILISLSLTDEEIVGHCVIRDYLVLFTHTPSVDRILRYTIGETTLSSGTAIYSTTSLYDSTHTSALPEYLSTVGVYEDDDNIKVYWANSTSPIRFINITSVISVDKDRLNLKPLYEQTFLELDSIISGDLNSGRVQYAFSLYKDKGAESELSILTNPIDLYSDSLEAPDTVDIKGDYTTVDSGKGVQLALDNLDSADRSFYDKIRLYRVHYTDYGQLPTITIVNDFILTSSGDILLTDSGGNGLGTITPEEFAILSNIQYTAYTIEEKDNILFAANLQEEIFDIDDFDTRAYRFNSFRAAHLYENYGTYTSAQYTIDGTSPNYSQVADNANCINRHNDIDFDDVTSYEYIYQADGTTVGGEGENIEYYFSDSGAVILDDSTNAALSIKYGSSTDYTKPTITIDNTSFQMGEIYRWGVVFYNGLGQRSSAKWIGDIRFPVVDREFVTSSSIVTARPISINFTLKNTPSDAVSWEIVRVKREKADRTVVTSGYLTKVYDRSTSTSYKSPWPLLDTTQYPGSDAVNLNDKLFTFVSAEECYQGFTDVKSGDYIHTVGILFSAVTTNYPTYDSSTPVKQSIKYKEINAAWTSGGSTVRAEKSIISDVKFINDTDIDSVYNFSEAENGVYTNQCYYAGNVGAGNYVENQQTGRSTILETSDTLFTSYVPSGTDIPYVNIFRNNYGRYGGYSIEAKELNKYISCGTILPIGTSSVQLYSGDTFITYFDYLTSIYNQTTPAGATIPGESRVSISVIFPTESPINNSLRSDEHFAKNRVDTNYLMKEAKGLYISTGIPDDQYNQETDLYLYNPVYSQENNINFTFSSELLDLSKNLDVRIAYSNTKIYDEPIDSWTKFRANNFLDVESKYGPIKSLVKFKNNLYYYQDHAFGGLSVNQRSLISDNNLGSLVLGTGDTLARFDYIDEYYGVQHKKSIDDSKGGIYFFDKDKKSILNFNGEAVEIFNDSKKLTSYVNNLVLKDIPFVTSSEKQNEVYYQLSDKILVFNNFTWTAIADYELDPNYLADIGNFTIGKLDNDDNDVIGFYLGSDYGSLDGGTTYLDSVLKLNSNENFYYTKTFDNLLFFTDSRSGGEIRNTDYFNGVRFWNDYQYTGVVNLTLGSNLQRRERGYSLAVPRNIVNVNGTTNIDIFNAANHNTSRQFKERMRDKYLTTEFIYKNTSSKGQLTVPYISFLYRVSKR